MMALGYQIIDKDKKDDVMKKLNRIEGRIRGIATMVEENRHIEDIMMQVSASYESLRVVMKALVKKQIEEGVNKGLISTNQAKKNEAYESLVNDIFKYVR